jgi:hypothetical protein
MITLRLSHKENEKCGIKKYVKVVSNFFKKNKASSNGKFISDVH